MCVSTEGEPNNVRNVYFLATKRTTHGKKWMCLIVSVLLCLHLCTDLSLLSGSLAFVWDLGEKPMGGP